ncbi:DUF6708 domain-containing protein [Pseudomonas sp. NY15372]|uniref:DUF6708 domain-containing protein n=1 Tax=Pseudomonas sp. NY15372 TaxID=3400356 RepID=UPI003A89AE8A
MLTLSLFSTLLFFASIAIAINTLMDNNYSLLSIEAATIIGAAWCTAFCLRLAISPPCDEPIRFNWARQKIYAYNFKYCWWKSFGHMPTEVVSYSWSDVRAESWRERASFQGASVLKWGVMLSIVESGTNKVIDRFPLSSLGLDEAVWTYVCTYMQEGPASLPLPNPPLDHNDVLWCDIAKRLVPKVEWPAEIDRESRTAPS